MTLRLCLGPFELPSDRLVALPDGAVRHLQVRRQQPGDVLRVFDGQGHEWSARVVQMGRQSAQVLIGDPLEVLPELPVAVTLALGMPANERMDALVEKATELGVAAIQPLLTERSVLRLQGERAQRRQAHWQGIAASAAEQCGRATVPVVHPVVELRDWLDSGALALAAPATARWVLLPGATQGPSQAWSRLATPDAPARLLALSGPEGGLAPAEAALARQAGFAEVGLGPRVLRADTAPVALLAWLALQA